MNSFIVYFMTSSAGKKILKWLAKWEYNRAKERERRREEDAINHANNK